MRISAIAFGFLTLPVHAEVIGYEPFSYPNGSIGNANGGSHWDYKNVSPTGHSGTPSDWDVTSGVPIVTDGRLITSANAIAKREYNGPGEGGPPSDEANGAVNDVNVAKKVYYKVTYTHASNVTFSGMSSLDFGTERIFFGVPFGQTNFGVQIVGFNPALSNTAAVAGQTYTLVAKLDYAGDVVAIFVNPDLSQPEPAPSASLAYTGTNWSTAVRLASGGTGSVAWDDLMVATTWENLGRIVTNAADTGAGSLRQVLSDVSAAAGADVVTFAPALSGQTITTGSGIALNDAGGVTLDASALSQVVTISGNRAHQIFSIGNNRTVAFNSITFADGKVDPQFGLGGAIQIGNSALVTIRNCSFVGNSASGGGALLNDGLLTLIGSTFQNNTGGIGGAIYCRNTATMSDCTFSDNAVTDGGGAILNTGSLNLNHTTISGNSASNIGGGYARGSGGATLVLNNSIIAGNSAPTQPDVGATDFTGSNNITTGNPLLSSLGYFGGPTMTMHPLVGSPAIDAGAASSLTTDQRGFPRAIGSAVDCGAVEAGPVTMVTTRFDENNGTGAVSLREAIALAVNPGHRIAFDHSQFPQLIPLTLGELSVPVSQSIFIDASDISGGVAISGLTSTRIFNVGAAASLAIRNMAIVNGKAPDGAGEDGGGILNGGTLEVQSSTILNNHAGNAGGGFIGGNGGGVFSFGRSHFVDSGITQNHAGDAGNASSGGSGGNGGGLFNAGNMILNRCTISGNLSGDGGTGFGASNGTGGGLRNESYLTLRACTVSNNTVGRFSNGGGIESYGHFFGDVSRLALYACTVSGNEANAGGGIDAENILLVHTTVSGNRAVQASGGGNLGQGGGIEFYVIPPTLENSIVAGNQASPDPTLGPDIYNPANLTIITVGTNLIGDTSGSGSFSTPVLIGPARLALLGNYGGPTETMIPLPDSPAINAASVGSLTDQRGFARDAAPDIGATEYRGYADVALYWDGDFDGDGLKNGLEFALGTDALVSDRQNSRNLRITLSAGHPHLTFGYNRPSGLHFKWTVSRQTDLNAGSALIYSYDESPSSVSTFQGPNIQVSGPTTQFDLTDSTPNQPKAFYTLQADVLP